MIHEVNVVHRHAQLPDSPEAEDEGKGGLACAGTGNNKLHVGPGTEVLLDSREQLFSWVVAAHQ